jgi:hypothetical protein
VLFVKPVLQEVFVLLAPGVELTPLVDQEVLVALVCAVLYAVLLLVDQLVFVLLVCAV